MATEIVDGFLVIRNTRVVGSVWIHKQGKKEKAGNAENSLRIMSNLLIQQIFCSF